ncbi:hypothetical protein DH2020_040551 [Rehmannia glutinosa]|uniref:Morc S5 domain-containing protein n=1 Tax=Rehmannia glutinosa TaxID=99300 RepID=A0ABR0UTU1_REHGL
MPPERQKQIPATADVIDLDSSDGEDGGPVAAAGVSRINNTDDIKPSIIAKLQTKPPTTAQSASEINSGDVLAASNRPLDNRSFWRAGAYEIGPTISTLTQGDLEHARVHPKFLHSNATSHKWAFGAIAELLDNAVDEVFRMISAKDAPIWDREVDENRLWSTSHVDNLALPKAMKRAGLFLDGNGFKTSTMRLGADVIVFSRAARSGRATQSIGLLSYTFLRRTRQDDVIVPMIDFDISENWAEPIIYSSKDDWSSNLKTIIEWSPASKDDLMLQFNNIGSHGTKIIIYNLWMNDEGIYELNFDDDDEDIRLRDEANHGNVSKASKRVLELQSHLSYRMRKFTNFKIILRGKPVEQFSIVDDLKYSKTFTYSPQVSQGLKEVTVETIIGFIKEAPALGVCGFNVYHKNRLIRLKLVPYWKVTADGNSKGHGVVGVLESNFIEPAHDKQDFERSPLFNKLEARLKQMVMEYWRGHCHLIGHQPDGMRKNAFQNRLTTQPQVEVSGNTYGTSVNNKSATVQSILGPEAGSHTNTSLDTRSLDQICEENIQLFMRDKDVVSKGWRYSGMEYNADDLCEEYKVKQVEKIRTIEELEKELEETRKKYATLSSELQRMQTVVTQR